MPDGSDRVAELAVDAAAIVELLIGWPGRALVLNAADAANPHNQDDQHQDEGNAEGPDDDVEGVPGHVGETLCHVPRLPLEVDFTVCSHPAVWAMAGITIGLVQAGAGMMAGVTVTFIDLNVALFTCKPWSADTCAIEAFAVTSASIQTADVSAGVLVRFTVDSFVFCQAHALIAINEVPAGGSVQAWSRETFIVFLLTVEAVVTWVTEALVAGAHTAAGAVSARAERTEVDQLGAGRPREARAAAAAEVHSVRVAGAVVLARRRGARVHLFFTGRSEVSFWTLAGESIKIRNARCSISAWV